VSWVSDYVGLPFAPFGRGPEVYDCWGLVRAVFADRIGVDLPMYDEIGPDDRRRVAEAMTAGCGSGPWQPVDRPREFDVMVARRPGWRLAGHVGVMLGARDVLHVWKGSGVHVARVNDPALAGIILGYQRHEALA